MFLTALSLVLFAEVGTADVAVVDAGVTRVVLDKTDGSLEAIIDTQSDVRVVDNSPSDIWRIEMLGTDIPALTPAMAKDVDVHEEDGNRVTIAWSGFGAAPYEGTRVVVEVRAAKTGTTAWRIRIHGLRDAAVKSIYFPHFSGILQGHSVSLAAPIWMGQQARDARRLLGDRGRLDWEYPGILSMQLLSIYNEQGAGVYLAANDTAAMRKLFAAFGGDEDRVGTEIAHLPEASATSDTIEPAYDVLVGAHPGDWFASAARYRDWASKQHWVRESRVQRGLVPDWVRDTGIWVWNRGRSPGVLGPAGVLREHSGMRVSVFWHWWHGCSYDTGFPEYLPPREGTDAFREAMQQAHEQDIHAIVYMNQRLWGMDTKSWSDEGAERFAVKDAAGNLHKEVYNIFTKAPCAPMCIGTPFWRNKYAGLAQEAVTGLGVDGIYMDQACLSLACYDASHGHPLGGGNYWIDGFRTLAADIRARCAESKTLTLAGEGCGEAWLPHLDLMLSLQVSMDRYAAPGAWEPVPMFQAVYHDSAIQYGNYSSLTYPPYDDLWPAEFAPEEPLKLLDRKFSTQFRFEQARSVIWGQQPTIANFLPEHLETRAEEIAYVIRLTKLRQQAAKYLVDGTLLGLPDAGAGTIEIPVSRLSIYAGQQDQVKEYTKTIPKALASAWRAKDGDIGVAIANVTDTPVTAHLNMTGIERQLSRHSEVHFSVNGEPQSNPAETARVYEIPGEAMCLVEFVAVR